MTDIVRIAEGYQDKSNGVVLIRKVDGDYEPYVPLERVHDAFLSLGVKSTLHKHAVDSMNRMLNYMIGSDV